MNTKPRLTPYFATTKTANLKAGPSKSLEDHVLELISLEALTETLSEHIDTSKWTTTVDKRLGMESLSLAAFRGKVSPNPDTKLAEPQFSSERGLGVQAFYDLGLLDGLDQASKQWTDDDTALGINFSRLHRMAKLLQDRGPGFMSELRERIATDVRAQPIYKSLISDAETRAAKRADERAHQARVYQEAEDKRRIENERAAEAKRQKDLAVKRKVAKLFDVSFKDDLALDNGVTIATNTSTKGYENNFGAPMPGDHAGHGPFTWVRVNQIGTKVYYDARGQRISEPKK